ncbi:hypothetical protein [uncultured Intestinimonas sp.]|uniref:hypothetical protein n=1 Tax=uncultured Intestinimonas sp. TaxID=1689265 RepID=UPI002942BCB0|nr:hypothetical protein [uncultured Intestinimonas sp.]
MFLTDNLWTIFEVAREERTDGDNFEGDLGTAPDLFLNALRGNEDFACLAGVDKAALLATWEAEDQAAAKAEYKAVVGHDPDHKVVSRYKELTAAFTAGDRETFEAVKAEALDAYHAALGAKG